MLFEPIRLGAMTLPNRIVVPAMVTRLSGEDGLVNEDIRDRYVRFAQGGAGLVVVEAMAVHGSKSGPLLRISSEEFEPGLSDLATRCHDVSEGKIVPQIIHFLKIARSGWRQTVDMLSLDEIRAITDAYALAAVRARRCGFDGVELHMAHAYTLSSFLSRKNPRKDAYGGSLENRLRLPSEVLSAVRRAVGEDFPVGIRFVAEECIKDGYTWTDAALIAERFARLGVDWVSLSAGGKFEDAIKKEGEPLYPYTGYSGDRCMPGSQYPDGANVHLAENVRRHLRQAGLSVPVCAAGKIGDRALAESILEREQADLIGMARALLADPDIPRKWREGREDAVVRCLYGNVCKALDESFRRVTCTLWPKGSLQAPLSEDRVPPEWSTSGPALGAVYRDGQVVLTWSAATDNEAMYGYQVFRAGDDGILSHFASVRARSHRFEDRKVLGGHRYRYALRPYDLAGNRGAMSPSVEISVPLP
jgi:dimethylglycine catabolism A